MDYDIIGGVHVHADKLLQRPGYREETGTWRQPNRKTVFANDYSDLLGYQAACVVLWLREPRDQDTGSNAPCA